jgi:hypothetical protein
MSAKPSEIYAVRVFATAMVKELTVGAGKVHLQEEFGNDLQDLPGAKKPDELRMAYSGPQAMMAATFAKAFARDALHANRSGLELELNGIDANLAGLSRLALVGN